LEEIRGRIERSTERLASGRRIASASDDAAGLGISERMRARLRSLTQAAHETRGGVDRIQVADAALDETSANLGRLRELAVQASNGTLSPEDRAALQEEADALAAAVDAVASDTEVNGQALLDGGAPASVQVGPDAGDAVELPTVDASAAALGVDGIDLSSAASAADALAAIDGAIDAVGVARGDLGAAARELASRHDGVLAARDALVAADARISSLDVALESARLAQDRILADASVSTLLQANAQPQRALRLLL
jgi:flagellin